MKKTLLSLALVSASLPSLANEFHGSFSGMSGAAYSTGNYSEGVLLNPSLGASYNPEKDDFALLLSAGALVSDKDDLLDQADELVDLLKPFSNKESQTKPELTQELADDLINRLEKIDGATGYVQAGANFALSIPTDFVSIALIVNSQLNLSLSPTFTDEDRNKIKEAVDEGKPFNSSDLTSSANGYGAWITDYGVSLSKAFKLENGNHLLVGFKPKKVEVKTIVYTASVADTEEDDFDSDKYIIEEDSMNYDLGLTYLTGNMRYGFVVNNLQDKDYKTINPDEVISIERQMIGSVGYVNGNLKAEIAVDLNAVSAIGLDGDTQMLRAGLEYSAWDWVRLRAGIQQDQKNTMEDTYSFGIGVGALNLAYITGSDKTEGFALSGGIRF